LREARVLVGFRYRVGILRGRQFQASIEQTRDRQVQGCRDGGRIAN
jgi:hypothetical protein